METVFTTRLATAADVPAIAALHVTVFKETHGSIGAPEIALRVWQWEQVFMAPEGNWFCLVMETASGGLIGFAKGQAYQEAAHSEFAGELNKIYLLREYQGRGLGKRLIGCVARAFIQRNIRSMLLFGDADLPANKFYERMGAERLFAGNGDFHGGYGWKDLSLLAAGIKNV
ncbi:GNAT family N-acetyltransferase [Niabella pedocola]|uniref:GNAT family N-acetyltransferase n=1 Tax=Niabella pedocola TaxID=1752077 RepID=A0ABS8PNS3_9BACT|nr:GNAT family N-acetyltransferase [Niabella pedocola]MCD2422757.1 GNAT family N-acetyltransferase [Niabella pedocola]